MYGRYGSDQLNIFLLVLFWILWIVQMFVSNSIAATILSTLSTVCFVFYVFRTLSRNYSRRHGENEAFMKVVGPALRGVKRKRNQMRDRQHAYFKCPSCAQMLRVPRGKGKISITCRSCGTVFQEKT